MSARTLTFWTLVAASVILAGAVSAQALTPGDPRIAEARATFLDRMVVEHDFDRAELTALLESATIDESILRSISRPAERVVPWYEYRQIFLNDSRIEAGANFWRENAELVDEVAAEYGVAQEIILAIVGVESLFGQRMGRYRVLDSLSTLAFAYPPRATFFSSELEQFLLTARSEGPAYLDVLGSYAGAMGAGQFISSSYEAYAVDGDADGRRDLWTNWPDILSSVANYFARHGWRAGETVVVPAIRGGAPGAAPANGLDLNETVASLRDLGYLFDAGDPDTPVMLIGLESSDDALEYWVGLHNFRVITRYNRSVKYALAVHQLSQAIVDAYDVQTGEAL